MRTVDFAQAAQLGMRASSRPPWREPLSGRIVALTKPRYGAWIRDDARGAIEYTDSVWIEWLGACSTGEEQR